MSVHKEKSSRTFSDIVYFYFVVKIPVCDSTDFQINAFKQYVVDILCPRGKVLTCLPEAPESYHDDWKAHW